jgi:hypothetical protein
MIRYKHEVGTKWYERDLGADTRTCLKCQKAFISESIDNRICNDCKQSVEWKHPEQGFGHNGVKVAEVRLSDCGKEHGIRDWRSRGGIRYRKGRMKKWN